MPGIHCAILGFLRRQTTECGDISGRGGPTLRCVRNLGLPSHNVTAAMVCVHLPTNTNAAGNPAERHVYLYQRID